VNSVRRGWLRMEPLLVVALFVLAWYLTPVFGLVSPKDLPSPLAIFASFVGDVTNPTLWIGFGFTIGAWIVGLLLVIVVAVPLGLALGLSRLMYALTAPTIEVVRTIPTVAALPVLVFFFGTSVQLTFVLVVLAAVWPLLIQTMYGARDVDPVATETARVYGLGRVQWFTRVVVPTASPYMATGLRLTAIVSLIIAVVTSLVVGGQGLGALIASASQSAQVSLMYSRILFTGLVGLAVTLALTGVENWILRWHPSRRTVVPS